MDFKELVTKLEDKGLDLKRATRIESLSGEHLIDYNPASDIVNLYPTLTAAAINDLNSLEDADRKVEVFVNLLMDQLCEDSFNREDGLEFEQYVLKRIKHIQKVYPELFTKFVEKFFINATLSYFVANKFGLRTCPDKVGGKGFFQYFALLDFLYDLDEETQETLIKDMASKHLWDVTEEDIANDD